MSSSPAQLRTRNLRTVAALAAVFVLPLVLSFWMYYAGKWMPAGRTNHGELLEPARALRLAEWPEGQQLFAGKWALVYVAGGVCEDACRTALTVMRQTRLSLNNEMTRVNRILLAGKGCCDSDYLQREHTGLIILDSSLPAAQPTLQVFPAEDRANSVYLVDPLGNLVLRYDARNNPKGLLQDLKKLLKLSHIG